MTWTVRASPLTRVSVAIRVRTTVAVVLAACREAVTKMSIDKVGISAKLTIESHLTFH